MIPTPKEYFNNNPLVFDIIVKNALDNAISNQKPYFARSKLVNLWFLNYAETRLRWLHANNKAWKKWIEKADEINRDTIIEFCNHWARAFNKNPETYMEKHPIEELLY